MTDFQTTCQTLANLDPYKRVNYVNGLVLGVDELVQEQLYHLEKHRLHNRALHGYGTVCGLTVAQRATPQGPEVIVGPGLAVNPQGLEIRLAEAHCAVLNHWLQRNRDRLEERFGSPPALGSPELLSLYLVLCHRECKTDLVPIPSGPCQTLEDSSAPSRIADAFELELRLDPPDQSEDNAVRELVALLGQIEISNAPDGLTQNEIEDLVRSLVDTGSPPLASPSAGPLHMHPDQVNGLLCAALRVWVTEVRPRLLPGDRNCASGPPDEDCILLAELRFDIDTIGGDFEVADEVAIIEEQRPYLLHTRLLQEWLLCGAANLRTVLEAPRTFASLFLLNPTTIRAWVHYPELLSIVAATVTIEVADAGSPVPQLIAISQPMSPPDTNVFDLNLDAPLAAGNRITVTFDSAQITLLADPARTLAAALADVDYVYLDRQGDLMSAYLTVETEVLSLDDLADVETPAPEEGEVLTRRGAVWTAEAPTTASDHGGLSGLADDDHPQYLLADGSRALSGDLSAGGNRITGLAEASTNGDAVRFEQAVKIGDAAGGDLRGAYPNPTVRRLRGRQVANIAPLNDQVLTWNATIGSGRWEPQSVGGFVQIPPAAGPYAIVAAGWFNFDGSPAAPPSFNDLKVVEHVDSTGDYVLFFPNYKPPPDVLYIVKGTVADMPQVSTPRSTFQFIQFENQGIRVRVLGINNEPVRGIGFMVEISAYGDLQFS